MAEFDTQAIIARAKQLPTELGVKYLQGAWPGMTNQLAIGILDNSIPYIFESDGTLYISQETNHA